MASLSVASVAANLAAVRARIDAAALRSGRSGADVEILAAVKYVAAEDIETLADAGVTIAGENRAQDLLEKITHAPGRLRWHFIGALQSRKVRQIAPHVELIHSVASDSALRELGRHAPDGLRILVEVNVSGEDGKAGIAPGDLDAFIARAPVEVAGLMTMPPLASDPQLSRPHFARLAELAQERDLATLSMGTSQDFETAVEEGATIVRIGTILFH
ncbi:MAG TPA: YggS family pyridoxal phosphate-dependent enzyme [Solirubrobacteraceae bacterium]|nr:YggS family pyridoxal phosphate-dependent enzyme [Solirubrobacteraceae bacterium]